MNKTIKSRKGATLSELVIVLAVLVIASGMVVTFSSMMHGAQGVSNERHEALQDVVTAEALIEGFIEKLESLYPSIKYVNKLMTHSWGQKVIRFYDLDGNLIEVRTPM